MGLLQINSNLQNNEGLTSLWLPHRNVPCDRAGQETAPLFYWGGRRRRKTMMVPPGDRHGSITVILCDFQAGWSCATHTHTLPFLVRFHSSRHPVSLPHHTACGWKPIIYILLTDSLINPDDNTGLSRRSSGEDLEEPSWDLLGGRVWEGLVFMH